MTLYGGTHSEGVVELNVLSFEEAVVCRRVWSTSMCWLCECVVSRGE
jgi:hypothetical protein